MSVEAAYEREVRLNTLISEALPSQSTNTGLKCCILASGYTILSLDIHIYTNTVISAALPVIPDTVSCVSSCDTKPETRNSGARVDGRCPVNRFPRK
jgi:hypothetical protein